MNARGDAKRIYGYRLTSVPNSQFSKVGHSKGFIDGDRLTPSFERDVRHDPALG